LNEVFLSASMIVRDEARFLAECLNSIRFIVDEIVIVDTGSTDQTKAIARKFNARIYDFPWSDDFSRARNEALNHCAGEWILYIDADERLRHEEREGLKDLLSTSTKVAFTVKFHPITGYTAYREFRLFRNDPRIRFKGVIHETIVPSISAVAAEDKLEIGKSNLVIDHIGYDEDQAHKHMRNLPLLKTEVKRDPKRIYLWWHLGVVLKALGDLEGAEEAWKSAIGVIREKKTVIPADSQPYYELVRLRYEKGEDVKELLAEAEERFPGNYLIIWMKGMVLMHEKCFEDAIPLFKYLTFIDPTDVDGGPLAYDARIFHVLSYEPLATCYYKIGRFEESEIYYALAEQCDPKNLNHKAKRLFVSTLIKK
jgi:glycosyltransferase involved in cell wall biosynthesis